MMHLYYLCGLLLALTVCVFASPTPQGHRSPMLCMSHPQDFFLRANCSGEPWHARHLVVLPSSHQLGLENFTVSPTTPPVKFRPVKLTGGKYALRAEGGGVEPIGLPYLAALKSTTGTRTMSMAIVYAKKLALHSDKFEPKTCLEGYECVVDQWVFDKAGTDMIYHDFRFAGYQGNWKPFKDAGEEGWHVYWKGDTGLDHPIQMDLAPTDGHEDCATTSCSH